MNLVHPLTHRDMLGDYLNRLALLGIGVEVGSAFGQFAGRILATWKGKELYLVDPWQKQEGNEYLENTNQVAPFSDWEFQCQELAKRDARAVLKKGLSVAVAKEFPDYALDFVYIDGNHDFGHVMADLDAWYPKVKIGGLIGGHDFMTNHDSGACCDVDTAVLRWTREHNVPFTVTACTSWWFIK